MVKKCRICKCEKTIEQFYKKRDSKDGFRNECKECAKIIISKYKETDEYKIKRKEYDKLRYLKNKEKILENKKIYYERNKENIIIKKREYYKNDDVKMIRKEWWQKYKIENIEKIRNYHRYYRKNCKDKIYQWRENNKHQIAWRTLLYSTLKRMNTKKEKHTIEILGYSAEDLKLHLESKFLPGMSWENYGEWHIDHIIPVSHFPKDTPVSIVCSLDNLQPLWASTRIIDGTIYEGNLNKNKKIKPT